MTVRLRHPRLSLTLLVIPAALLLGWWGLSTPVFMVLAITVVTIMALVLGTWDAWHQTQPDQLAARGIYPDDRTLTVYDPGLRREFTPMVPAAVSQRMALRQTRRKTIRQNTARPDATVNFAVERRDADLDDLFAALDDELIGLVPVKKKVEQIGALSCSSTRPTPCSATTTHGTTGRNASTS
jgi:hypothetical protein